MICKQCAWEADSEKEGRSLTGGFGTYCPVCVRQVAVYCTDPAFPSFDQILVHKDPTTKKRCGGSKRKAMRVGHRACTGCDCAHHPVGTRQQKEGS